MKKSEQKEPVDLGVVPEPKRPTKTTKFINYIIGVALIVIALALAVFLKWSLADTTVLDVKNDPFPARVVEDPTGQTGGIVFLKVDYCKTQNVDGKIRVSYISKSREVFLPIADEKLPKGCNNQQVPVVVPLNLLQDTYKIKFHVTYNVNPVKKGIVADFESQSVMVGTTVPNQP